MLPIHMAVVPDSLAVAGGLASGLKDAFGILGAIFGTAVVTVLMMFGARAKALLQKLPAGWSQIILPVLSVVVSSVLLWVSQHVPILQNAALMAALQNWFGWIGLGGITGLASIGVYSGVKNVGQGVGKVVIGG